MISGNGTAMSSRDTPDGSSERVLVTWELASGVSSMLHVLWEWHQANVRRNRILEIALRQGMSVR